MTGLAWILFWLTIPMVLLLITKIVDTVMNMWPVEYRTVERIVYVDRPVTKTKTVHVDRPVTKTKTVHVDRPKKTKITQKKSDKSEKPDFLHEVVSGLSSLGLKKTDAKKMVSRIYSPKTHPDVDSLLKDCISKL